MAQMFKAELPDMLTWARGIMASRPPDVVIGDDYLRRWWLVPRNDSFNLYLHDFRGSDDDRALHDHPWPSTSFILDGRYREFTPQGVFERRAGDVNSREAEALHRVELYPDETAVTLFATGAKCREWGFACPQGWVHWADFTDPDNPGAVGKGCGEYGDRTPTTPPGQPRLDDLRGLVGLKAAGS
ncbi:hypothetical protein ACRAQ6_14075 [Erythrobacter sp. HA6-11]